MRYCSSLSSLFLCSYRYFVSVVRDGYACRPTTGQAPGRQAGPTVGSLGPTVGRRSGHSQNCHAVCSVSEVEVRMDIRGVRGVTRAPPAGHHLRNGTRASSACPLFPRQVEEERERGGACYLAERFAGWGQLSQSLEARGWDVLAMGN